MIIYKPKWYTYLENGHPSQAYIIKWNSSFERVFVPSPTVRVILIPVNTGVIAGRIIAEFSRSSIALNALIIVEG